jgi:hypothetical protein
MKTPTRFALALIAAALVCASAQAASPTVGVILPRGAQRGTEVELNFLGDRLADVQEAFCYSPGFTFDKFTVVNNNHVKAKVKIAPDCRLGEHAFRLRTATGISELRTFFVGALPTVECANPPPLEFGKPQKVPLNATVQGIVNAEQAHYFAVDCKKGQRLTAEVEAMRLGNTLFDPFIAIFNTKRFELAVSDDAAIAGQDGVASIIVPEDGEYIIQIRETSFGGNGNCHYRLHVGAFPRPLACLPAGGKPGEELEVTFLGDVKGPFKQKVKLPAAAPLKFGLFAEDDGGICPSPVPFRLGNHDNAVEMEPNDSHGAATPFDPRVQAVSGVIERPGDIDFYRFTLKKGETFDVNCFARRLRTPLDPVMVLYNFNGGAIVGNDDSGGPDSYFRITAPNDAEYVLSIQDHLGKGGPEYAYRVEFTPVKPSLLVTIPKVDGNNAQNQDRQSIAVPRGGRMACLLYTPRTNFGGELVIEAQRLPQGVKLNAGNVAPNVDVLPVVFEAAADAPLAGALCDIQARHADPQQNIRGHYRQHVDLVYIQNQGGYTSYTADQAAIAVTQELPFSVRIEEPKVPLVQNGSMNLKIVAERKEGFAGPISVYMLWNPPGVGSASGVTIQPNQTEILYPINANGGAPTRQWKIAVIAVAGVPSGPVWTSSQLATLEVAAPFVAMTMDRPAVEQGQETDLVCKVHVSTPFEGPAKVRLLGLPHAVTASELDLTKDMQQLIFKVKTDKASPPGQHQNIFAQVVVSASGEPIVHNVGGTVLRIDPPPPPKPTAPAAPQPTAAAPQPAAPQPAATKPAEKPLTRLEKLRKEQEERAKGEKPPK